MLNTLEHVLLVVGMLNLLQSYDFFFAENFDGIVSEIMYAAH
jgi:hypothetical protein